MTPSRPGFGERHPILASLALTVSFVAALVLVTAVSARLTSPQLREGTSAAGRLVISVFAIVFAARASWLLGSRLTSRGSGEAWVMVAVPMAWIIAVYPPLFTGSWAPVLEDPGHAALVAANGFSAGLMEEIVFRGLVLGLLLRHWGTGLAGVAKAVSLSSTLFGALHLLNVFGGQEPLFVAAQFAWSVLLGAVFGVLVVLGGSVWPAAAVHGVANAIVHTNRIGVELDLTVGTALLLVAATIPLVIYAIFLLRIRGRKTADSGASINDVRPTSRS